MQIFRNILVIELLTGLILNTWLGLGIWDYSGKILSGFFYNQICLQNAIIFFLVTPFFFWVDDTLRFLMYEEGTRKNLFNYYKRLVTFK